MKKKKQENEPNSIEKEEKKSSYANREDAFRAYFEIVTKIVYTLNLISDRNDMTRRLSSNIDRALGYDDEMIAGIMGNMNPESGILYGTTQGHKHDNYTNAQCVNRGCIANEGTGNAHGLCQWDGGRRNKLIKVFL